MEKIAIVGASGHGKVVADLAEICGFDVVFFDDAFSTKTKLEGWEINGSFADLLNQSDKYTNAIVAIGDNEIRARLSNILVSNDFILPALIHPNAVISKYADIASGTVVFANAVINTFAKIGENCIINTGTIVEHDCILGNAVHLSPRVALGGGTVIDSLSWIGIGSVTRQLVHIGSNSIIGANSTVLYNIPKNVTAFGSPAVVKELKLNVKH